MAAEALAQDSLSHKHGISIGYAAAVATGEFRSTAYEKVFPPMAKKGGFLSLSYTYHFKPKVYVGTTLGWRHIAFDLDTFASPDDELAESRESTPWQTYFTTVDVQYNLHMRHGFLFAKGMVGPSFNKTYTLQVDTPYGTVAHSAAKATALAYGASLGAHVRLKRFGLGIDTGILMTKPTFKRSTSQGERITYRQPMHSIQSGIFGSFYL